MTNADIINKTVDAGSSARGTPFMLQLDEPNHVRLQSATQEHWFPEPGTVPEGVIVHCGVCGDAMECTRDISGPTSFVMAMAKSKRDHDSFFCPNRDRSWHQQVVALRDQATKTPSGMLGQMFMHEAAEIAEHRKCTKVRL